MDRVSDVSTVSGTRDHRRFTLLTVCGSLQDRSANDAALGVAERRAGELGHHVDAYRELADIPAFNADAADPVGRAVAGWRRRVGDADAVLLAVPEYAGGMAGVVKNALDWLVGSGDLYGKPTAMITAGTSGGIHARRTTVQTLLWQGAFVVGDLGIAAPRTKMTGRTWTDPATVDAIVALVDRIIDAHGADQPTLTSMTASTARANGIDAYPRSAAT